MLSVNWLTYKAWNSKILSTLIWSHLFDHLSSCSSCEKGHFCLSRCSGIIFQLGINWLITKNSISNSLKLYNFLHSNLKSLVRSVASSLLMWKSVTCTLVRVVDVEASVEIRQSSIWYGGSLGRWFNRPTVWWTNYW